MTRFAPYRPQLVLFLWILCSLSAPAVGQSGEDSGSQNPSAQLADILEDEGAREKLITELRRSAEAAGETASAQGSAASGDASPARRIARFTQDFAEGVVDQTSRAVAAVRSIGAGDGPMDWPALSQAVFELAAVIAATVVLFLVLRGLARPLFSRANGWALRGDSGYLLLRRAAAVFVAALIDLGVIALAWVGGYATALFLVGDPGAMNTHHSLFLNAFLLIEIFKALLRMVFASRDSGLRLLPLSGEDAEYWNSWLARLSGFIGYSLLLVVPVINENLSEALGRVVSVVVMILGFAYALTIILQNRASVRSRLEARAAEASFRFTGALVTALARIWHLLAIAYFAALTVITVTRPEDALPYMVKATGQTLAAIGIGVFISVVLTQIMRRRIRVPEDTRLKYPMLENRLNSFVPTALAVVRAAIMVVVAAVTFDAWGLFDAWLWITSDGGSLLLGRVLTVGIIVVLATALWIVVASWIESRLNPGTGDGGPGARQRTLLALFRNAVAIVLITMTLMISLSEFGINIGPLIAGAGVLGLAIGFGAQKLVQDIITGVFIQLENAINTGDVITAGGVTGVAEQLSIRSVRIRDLSGTLHIMPFSSVNEVSNYMRDFAYHIGEYGIAYREDIDEVITHLRAAFEELRSDPEQGGQILDDLEVHGVTALADSSVNVRVRIKTLPGSQWSVGRAYNRLVKRHLDAAGIEIPFPHMTLYFGEDKSGEAPPANVRMMPAQHEASPETTDDTEVDTREARVNPRFKGDFDDDG
ncbi:MAG: mechanosensitive ion channel [Gammaproteobacteria bacterium]|nr:mechanosensitive ion channel [Gammaproteobacteria bacterium]